MDILEPEISTRDISRTRDMAIWSFITIPDLKYLSGLRKKIRIVIIILISFHFCYFYANETSNCHNSGSSVPKISIRGPNSRSWCQLSDIPKRVMFLTILTLVLAGNSNAFLVFLHYAGLKGHTSKLLLGLKNRLKINVFTCIEKFTKMRLNEISNNEKTTVFLHF